MRGLFALLLAAAPAAGAQTAPAAWLAFRVDSSHVAVFFNVADVRYPDRPTGQRFRTAAAFEGVVELPDSVARKLMKPSGVQFGIGDRYQLSLDSGRVVNVRLTAFVIGLGMDTNDSYLGAFAELPAEAGRFFTQGVYAVTRF